MKLMSANIEDLRSHYISNLKKALDMEQKITKALPDLIEKSTDSELSSALRKPKVMFQRCSKCFRKMQAKPTLRPAR